MQVLSVASEVFPLVKTGGLADVAGALPAALVPHGVAMRVLIPGYPSVMKALTTPQVVHTYSGLHGGAVRVLAGRAHGLDILAIDAPHLYERAGNPYLGPDGKDWPDNHLRYAALSQIAADIGRGAIKGYQPDVLHLHDWQAALAAIDIRYKGGPPTLLTVHNIAFQGVFPATAFSALALPPHAFAIDGLEYYNKICFLKGGLASATAISTVSPTYAQEICTPEYGMGMDGLLRERRAALTGIINGIDTNDWNPLTDKLIAARYDATGMASRAQNKRALEGKFDLDVDDGLLHGVVSRLTTQKGLDILAGLLDQLVESGARLALVGTGDSQIEAAFVAASRKHRGRIGVALAYDEGLAHLVQAGADTILVPSRFEPCGLTQLYGLRYGCVPVVARTGGLADSVIDANEAAVAAGVATGFQFSPVDAEHLSTTLQKVARTFADAPTWRRLQANGMAADVSWDGSARQYAALYRSLLAA